MYIYISNIYKDLYFLYYIINMCKIKTVENKINYTLQKIKNLTSFSFILNLSLNTGTRCLG